ncbi:transcription factor Gibbin [Synchiropus picturatus]
MQMHIDPDVRAHIVPHKHMDKCEPKDINANTCSVEHSGKRPSEVICTSPLSLALGNHPATSNQMAVPVVTGGFDFCPVSNTDVGSSPLPVEVEKKYALRSSGRPRFPCHLRKSSRLRRSPDEGEKRAEREKDRAAEETSENKNGAVKDEELPADEKLKTVEAALPSTPCPPDITALPVPKHVPKTVPKPGPRLGHKPGPKSKSRPGPKPVHKPGPKSVMKRRQAAQSQRAAAQLPLPNTCTITAPQLAVKNAEPAGGVLSPNGRRRGHFVGVRRFVVKVARIPVSLSRRQKSYKISNMETVTTTEKNNDGSLDCPEAVREPTALLRMKNNGKSVMVMFPPGELPVILKRRRGRPPKQAPPGIPGEPPNPGNATGNQDQQKKPRRRRRTKLPCPYPSYVNDTNDVKTEYGDVLSKLAFLNRQPPTTGRSSPPRCWTPTEPESFHTPMENPGISTMLHRLTGFRRPRGGRGGGVGRGGGASGGTGIGERTKSTFSDFFESIGKKRKLSHLTDHGLPRKRGKASGGGGVGRGGGVVGTEPGGEKIVRKRRARKNGAFKGVDWPNEDWPNGTADWGEDGGFDKEKGLMGYQMCGSPRGGFSSCEFGHRGTFGTSGGSLPAGEDSHGLFAGYFRSLLDSDDSSDLLDVSTSQATSRKCQSTTGFEPSSPAPGNSWSPGFSKWGNKGPNSDGSASAQGSSTRPSFNYCSLSQTSPTTFSKSTPPALSHSPSSPHPTSYGQYSSNYSASNAGAVQQRSSDCRAAYASGHNSSKTTALGHLGYSSYTAAAKRGFSGYGPNMLRGEQLGPGSPGGGYMSLTKGHNLSSTASPDGYKQYNSNHWNYRQGYGGCSVDIFGSQYHGYSEYGSNESKDILDISNYTPQKAKRQPFPESLSESSSDSSHLGSAAASTCPVPIGGTFKPNEDSSISGEGGQSSLSSLEKLMIDWHESASAPSYNWSQNVLFQSSGTSKPGRGRRKRTEHSEKEGGTALHCESPSSPSPTRGPRRGGRGRGSRGGRGGLSACQRERPSGARGRCKAVSSPGMSAGILEGPGIFQEGLDYYSGDSSSLSPLASSNPAPPSSYPQEPCEYPSPYSAHPSTPSSEERYPSLYPGESSSSLSPSVSSPPYPPKPTPPPPQSYHPVPSRNFSPSCSPSPRVTPHCGTAMSPSHRPPPKDPQFPQYDSPSYCSSPYWYGQMSHSGSPSPHSNTAMQTHNNPHTSPLGNVNLLLSPNANTQTLSNQHDTHHNTQLHANLSSHSKPYASPHLQNNTLSNAHNNNHHNEHSNTPLPSQSTLSPNLHSRSTPTLYEERGSPSTMATHRQDLTPQRQGTMPHSPYSKSPLESHQPDTSSYSLSQASCQAMGHRYPSHAVQGSGVLCQLLDPANDDSFSVTSL